MSGMDRCMSKMCSDPHRAIFGRCYCAKPKGHDGLHGCGGDRSEGEMPDGS